MSPPTKIGILEFRYQNFRKLLQQHHKHGYCNINLGDYIQSRAVQLLLENLGIRSEAIVKINRDALPAYSGESVKLIMNGCFYAHCFPLPSQIEPIFIGFQTSQVEVITQHFDFFKKHEPIGCRDNATRELFRQAGINAYTSGCLSTTLPHRGRQPNANTVFFIAGEGAGEMPSELRSHIPSRIIDGSTYVHQRERVASYPLSDDDIRHVETIASELISRYRAQASLIVTPLLHAASPCLAMGIPVILARTSLHDRFTAINRILPIHTPENFAAVNWNPLPVDLGALKQCLGSLLARRLAGGHPEIDQIKFLDSFYQKSPIPLIGEDLPSQSISFGIPDARSVTLIGQYHILHKNQVYGTGSERLFHKIQNVIEGFPKLGSILDYGCGQSRLVDWLAKVNGAHAHRFDPAIPQYDKRPTHTVDLVIVTNVMEHIPEAAVDATLAEIRKLSRNAYFHITTVSDDTTLPNGEKAHCTIRPAEWWKEKLERYYKKVRGVPPKSNGRCSFVTFDWRSMQDRKSAELSQIKEALADIRGQDCVIFGSAPNPDFGNQRAGEKIICCNGSALSLHQLFGRSPDHSFVHSHVFARRENEADADVHAAIGQCPTLGKLTIFSSSNFTYEPNLIPKNTNSVNEFRWDLRFEVIRQLTGIGLPGIKRSAGLPGMDLSTGAVSVACAFFGGARSVRLVGFSFTSKGHSYNTKGLYRNHVSSDAALYALLSTYGFPITSTEPSIAPLLVPKIE